MNSHLLIPIAIAFIGFLVNLGDYSLDSALLKLAKKVDDKSGVKERLAILNRTSEDDYLNFRIAQLTIVLSVVTFLLGIWLLGFISLGSTISASIFSSILTYVLTERHLTQRILRRKRAIHSEFPQIVEMLTLCISAGESPISAITRLSHRAHGYIAQEFKVVVTDLEQGVSLAVALDAMCTRLDIYQVRRFVDAILISLSRGTPLAQTLMSHAIEARSGERNLILKAAGRAEISMMIPVVFLILPISILFALFPSLSALNQFG